jgi:beta-1,2-mannobiose phosphorylase / 1,2-beta-oligomannan phosphorylase
MTRRELIIGLTSPLMGSRLARALRLFDLQEDGDDSGWVKYVGNPVLGGQYGTCFDVCVLNETGTYRMWVSWRPKKSIALTESTDGIHWSPLEIVLAPRRETGWEDDINRPVVVHREGEYHMWYTGQAKGHSYIGYATGADGRKWVRQSLHPVLEPSTSWEGVAVMCPDVMWDQKTHLWRLWYSAGQQYEPNAIGYATSADGLHWDKYAGNPVMKPEPSSDWEKDRVTGAQIIYWNGWYYSFYIGFRDVDHAQIGLARSKDGISNWVRDAANPIVRPTPGGWDADACYKPYVVRADGRWMLWYNGRHNSLEQIGLVVHSGESLGFVGE